MALPRGFLQPLLHRLNKREMHAAVADAVDGIDANDIDAAYPRYLLEGPFFTEKHKGAQNPSYFLDPDVDVFDEWRACPWVDSKDAIAPERAGLRSSVRKWRIEESM